MIIAIYKSFQHRNRVGSICRPGSNFIKQDQFENLEQFENFQNFSLSLILLIK